MSKLIKGQNDLLSQFPKIAAEWDYNKNDSDSPENYTTGSDKKFYWICNNGHDSYLKNNIVANRTVRATTTLLIASAQEP